MFDIGIQEIFIIMALALIVFGPDQLPELGRRLGRAMREFRRASDEFRRTVETNLHLDENPTPVPPSATIDHSDPGAQGTMASSTDGSTTAAGEGAVAITEAPEPAVASVTPGTSDSGESHGPGESLEPFWTTRGGRLLHRATCAWRARVPEADRVPLKVATDGWDLGLTACPVCEPREAEIAS